MRSVFVVVFIKGTQRRDLGRRNGDVKTEAEIQVLQLQKVNSHQNPKEERITLESPEEVQL